MKKRIIKRIFIMAILLVGIINVGCNSKENLFEEKNIIDLNISYLDKEKIKQYELKSGEKYPYSHLLKITNNSTEVIEDGDIKFEFINDSGIQEEVNAHFYTIAPGESYFTYITSTKQDISPSRIKYTLKESQLGYELLLADKKVYEYSIASNEFIDFDEHNIISFNTNDITLEDKGYMTNIFVNTHNFDFINNSDLEIENASADLYFYDEDNNVIDVKFPYCSLSPNEIKSTYVKEDDLPIFTKEAASTELISYRYIIYDDDENYKWNYHIDLKNKLAYRNKFSID